MSNLKKLIRERMSKTGESYQVAHRVVTREKTSAVAASQAGLLPVGDGSILVSAPPPRREVVPQPRIYSGGAELLSALIPDPPKTQPSATGPTVPEHFEKLGELRADGDTVEQQVLVGPWRITYMLGADPDYVGVTIGGAGPAPMPDWLFPTARRYAAAHKARILEMLYTARHSEFRADRGGVSAKLNVDGGEVGVWFTRWDDTRGMVTYFTPGVDTDEALSVAVTKFLAIPEPIRKRLFKVARPFDDSMSAPNPRVVVRMHLPDRLTMKLKSTPTYHASSRWIAASSLT
jgi:hypothetical protein